MAGAALDLSDVHHWLDAVARGEQTMSQRQLARLELVAGGLEAVRAAAVARNVHLAIVVDDRGVELVAASRHPIRVLC
jgi:hypothetical protein